MLPLASLPLGLMLFAVMAIGMVLGSLVNWAAYRLAWTPRDISPWSAAPAGAPTRRWTDRIPVVGWLGLRREVSLHGRGFWIRPMMVELVIGLGLAALFWWEVVKLGLIQGQAVELLGVLVQQPADGVPLAVAKGLPLAQFLGHAMLIVFMAVATLIDIDEKLIPDWVTVPGTLLGLLLATLIPMTLLPHVTLKDEALPGAEPIAIAMPAPRPVVETPLVVESLSLTAPNQWPSWLDGRPSGPGLLLGLACYGMWCFALTPRFWRGRRGVWRGLTVITARIVRELRRPPLGWIALAGAAYIAVIWWLGGPMWTGLLSSLVGLTVSGAVVWAVRIVGTAALRREAMGFGDVTLMMMIGTYLGWQAGLIIFFVSPFAGLVVGVLQLLLKRDDVIPYGPFLCLGTLMVVVGWGRIWSHPPLQWVFGQGWLLLIVLLVGTLLLGVMLVVWQWIKRAIFGGDGNRE